MSLFLPPSGGWERHRNRRCKAAGDAGAVLIDRAAGIWHNDANCGSGRAICSQWHNDYGWRATGRFRSKWLISLDVAKKIQNFICP